MENFAKAKNTLLLAALALVLSLGSYIWSGHVAAEAAQVAVLTKAQADTQAEVKQLRDILIRIETYIANQQEINAWHISELQRANRGGN
jgi:predicted ATP-binding protein involved in virulence